MRQDDLIFLICAPRSGSTMLQRMLGSHSQIHTHPEPHLITPLGFLGYHGTVDKAPFDHINQQNAFREFCEDLPGGEEDVLDALRAYALTLYGRVTAPTGKPLFLDKTPEYGIILPFLRKLFPRSRYVVLTRHPMAILHSSAKSFFEGDYRAAHAFNPVLERYLPALGAFLRDPPASCAHVRYEDLVQDPESEMARVLQALGLGFESATVTYGAQAHIEKSYGDPMGVSKHDRPVSTSLSRWANDLKANPDALAFARDLASRLEPQDLAAWGYPQDALFAALEEAHALRSRVPWNAYRLKRKTVLIGRRWVKGSGLRRMVAKIRYACDVLLRD